MAKDIPRRMRRFSRDSPTEGEVKEKSAQFALREVDSFKAEHNRYPNPRELDLISQNVFDQLRKDLEKESEQEDEITSQLGYTEEEGKKSLLESRRERREKEAKENARDEKKKRGAKKPGEKPGEKKGGEQEEEPPEGDAQNPVEETLPGAKKRKMLLDFGEEGKDESADETVDEEENIKKLTEMDELSNLEEGLGEDDDSDLVEKEMETDLNVCPRCGNKIQDLIYCPKCGEAFCNHCAKGVEVEQQAVKYTCPKCGTEVRKKKPK